MRLDSLLAAADLAGAGVPVLEVRGDPTRAEITDHRPRLAGRRGRARSTAACRGSASTATTSRPRRSRPAPWRCCASGRSTLAVPQVVVAVGPARPRPARRRLLRPSVPPPARSSASPAPTARPPRPSCSPPSSEAHGWAHGDHRHPHRRPHHARGAGAAGHAGRVAQGGCGRGGHGGLVPRPRPAPGGRRALRGGHVHQPDPGPPRLPRHHGASTSRPRPGCSSRAGPTSRSSTPTTRGAAGCWPRSRPRGAGRRPSRWRTSTDLVLGPRRQHLRVGRRPDHVAARRPVQRGQRPRRGDHRPGARRARATPSPTGLAAVASVPGRFEPVDAGPAVHGAGRLRPHPRRPRAGAGRGPRAGRRPAARGLRRRRRPRPRQAAADGRGRPAGWPTWPCSPPTTPAARTPTGSSPTVRAGVDGPGGLVVEPDRARAIAARAWPAAGRATSS